VTNSKKLTIALLCIVIILCIGRATGLLYFRLYGRAPALRIGHGDLIWMENTLLWRP
jgi:hypothetical protein